MNAHHRSRYRVATLVGLALAGLSEPRASFAATRVGIVAPLAALGISEDEANRVHRWIVAEALRFDGYRWLAKERLTDVLQRPEHQRCKDTASCLGRLAGTLGAEVTVAGEVGSIGGGVMVYLRLVNKEGTVLERSSGVLQPNRPGLRSAARALVVQLLDPGAYVGSLIVTTDVENAWVYLDGQRLARAPTGTLTKIPVGNHALRVTHESHRDDVRFVSIRYDETTTVHAELAAYAVRARQMRLVDKRDAGLPGEAAPPWYKRWWAVASLGAVVFAATTVTVALVVKGDVQRDREIVIVPRQ